MYTRCIYCSAGLGRNETVEEFPVGRTLAFDGEKGRLWAVCSRCRRWNLAPIEERWEAVEELEKRFRDSRLRVQSENVGLAKAPDGTRLVRVGQALPGELAAWRYGREMRSRRWRTRVVDALASSSHFAAAAPLLGAAVFAPFVALAGPFAMWRQWDRSGEREIMRLGPAETGGDRLVLRDYHLLHATVRLEPDARSLRMVVHDPAVRLSGHLRRNPERRFVLPDRTARRVLRRMLVRANRTGADRATLDQAFRQFEPHASPDAYLYRLAANGFNLPAPGLHGSGAITAVAPTQALALEMALHHEEERRAMEGELAMLEAAWRQAEEIAAIADALPDVPPPLPPGVPPS